MIPNGFIIQGKRQLWVTDNCPYRGLGFAESWPLDDPELFKKDSVVKELSELARKEWFYFTYGEGYMLDVIPDVAFICKYIRHCLELGISIRVLLCETDRNEPKLDLTMFQKLEGHLHLLGYDYGTSQGAFSALADDFYGEPVSELEPLRKQLNRYGLFDTAELLDRYIETREAAIARGEDLETGLDFVKFRLSEVRNLELLCREVG